MADTFFEGAMRAIFIEEACLREGLSKTEKKKQVKVIKDCAFTKEDKITFASTYIKPIIEEIRAGKLVECKEGTVGCGRLVKIAEMTIVIDERTLSIKGNLLGLVATIATPALLVTIFKRWNAGHCNALEDKDKKLKCMIAGCRSVIKEIKKDMNKIKGTKGEAGKSKRLHKLLTQWEYRKGKLALKLKKELSSKEK